MINGIVQLLEDNHIHYRIRKEWVNVCCPYCGDNDYHLGLTDDGKATCFRCGTHNINSVIHELLHCGASESKSIVRRYICRSKSERKDDPAKVCSSAFEFKVPSSGNILRAKFPFMYLRRRFKWMSIDEFVSMVKRCGITYTDTEFVMPKPDGNLTGMFAERIVFPLIHNGIPVSYQCRDYTDSCKVKYMTAYPEYERIMHKDVLYGEDYVPYSKVIVCEGVFDALSIGAGAVHTFGVKWSRSQAESLCAYDKVYIAYDNDKAGKLGAESLASAIKHRVKVTIVRVSAKDINSCSQSEIEDIKALIQ
jgi:hypothetical protein